MTALLSHMSKATQNGVRKQMSVTHLEEDKLWETFPNTRGMVLARGEKLIMYYIEYNPNMTFPMHSHLISTIS